MAFVPLVEHWSAKPDREGVFAVGNTLPALWGPAPREVDSQAFPTPFGRAEAMRRVLAAIDAPHADAGSQGHKQEYGRWFAALTLGVVSGVLEVEVLDLHDTARFDNFGTALLRAEPSVRHLAAFVLPSPRRIYGYSHPRCLAWPHARRTAAELLELEQRLADRKPKALELLADFREVLMLARKWDPTGPSEWQRGLSQLIGAQPASSGLRTLHEDSRFVGPVRLSLTEPGRGPSGVATPVYLPVVERGFAQRFVQYTASRATMAESPRRVQLVDQRGKVALEIRLPSDGRGDGIVPIGAGVVQTPLTTEPFSPRHDERCLEDGPESVGLPRLLAEVAKEVSPSWVSPGPKACPVLFPDPIRILAERNLWRSVDGEPPLRCTSRAEQLALSEGGPGRLPDASAVEGPAAAAIATFGTGTRARRMLFVETLDGGRDVGDLRALGAALFLLFIGEGNASGGYLRDEEESPLIASSDLRPLQPTDLAYQRVSVGANESFGARLASLQRFVSTYAADAADAELGQKDDAARSVRRLLWRAAETFARWAHRGRTPRALGTKGQFRASLDVAGTTLALAVDALHHDAQGSSRA